MTTESERQQEIPSSTKNDRPGDKEMEEIGRWIFNIPTSEFSPYLLVQLLPEFGLVPVTTRCLKINSFFLKNLMRTVSFKIANEGIKR